MIAFVSVLVALVCAGAAARTVWFAANATALHPTEMLAALSRAKGPEAIEALRARVAEEPSADWERELLLALAAPAEQRVALVNEQLSELDYRIQRWSRVPRVCGRVSTSLGFVLATVVLRGALADVDDLSSDVQELVLHGPIGGALFAVAMGILGMAFCAGANAEAKRIAKARMKGADELIERLEELAGGEESGHGHGHGHVESGGGETDT